MSKQLYCVIYKLDQYNCIVTVDQLIRVTQTIRLNN